MTDDKMLDKVRKLLAKAEKAGTEHEAEAFTAKATELMLKYAIDEAMLQKSGEKPNEKIVAKTFTVKGYAKAKLELLRRVARGMGMDAAFYSNDRRGWSEGRAEVVGWESDMAAFEVLFASLQMQAAHEATRELARIKVEWPSMKATWDAWMHERNEMEHELWVEDNRRSLTRRFCPACKKEQYNAWRYADQNELDCASCGHHWTPENMLTYREKNDRRFAWEELHPRPEDPGEEMPHGRSFMQSFLIGYAGVVGSRLAKQRKATVKEAEDSTPGVALAVIDRDKAVDKFAHDRWDYGGGGSYRSASTSSNAGYYAGRDAGSRANLGQSSVGGGRRAIGGGR